MYMFMHAGFINSLIKLLGRLGITMHFHQGLQNKYTKSPPTPASS